MIRKLILIFLLSNLACNEIGAQAGANEANFMSLSANATAQSKMTNDVNLYTGMPSISLPLYNYNHHTGIGLSISADYFPGGIKVAESASSLGLGWNLNVGGVITRTVRGMPDEYPVNGYLFSPQLPADYRPNGNKYYYDSIDAEQDVFQFNFNGRSGKFFIGKNNEIAVVPLSKLQISYGPNPDVTTTLGTFTITTEDGVRYVFSDIEKGSSSVTGSVFAFGYQNFTYPQAWYLSKIIAPFSTDSIAINYTSTATGGSFKYPETVHVTGGTITDAFSATGYSSISGQRKVSSINLPDKKNVTFIYDPYLKYDGKDYVLDKIQFSDSIFRYGFVFDRQQIYKDTILMVAIEDGGPLAPTRGRIGVSSVDRRSFLSGIQYYTATATMPGYTFSYHTPYFQKVDYLGDTTGNKRDHWGFYKSSINNNGPAIPTVAGIYNGIDKSPSNVDDILASSLTSITGPDGGTTVYDYESNSIYPFAVNPQTIAINAISATQTNITLNQVVSNQYEFNVAFSSSVSRQVNPTFSGTANVTCSITSTNGSVVYATKTLSLFQAFYVGGLSFKAAVPNGSYLFKTTISAGTTAPSGLPLTITWDNETSAAGTGTVVGGVRLKSVSSYKQNYSKLENRISYKYVNTDGKSSGFLGLPPVYHYPVTRVRTTNGINPVTTYATAISSEPVSNLNYTQGNAVGYSRVEVIQENPDNPLNNGKTVVEFTSLTDAGSNVTAAHFPYAPVVQKEWALGLPKRTLIYDSTGRLVKSTTNVYSYTNASFENADFQSLKLGMTVYNTNYNTSTSVESPTTKFFTGQLYYPETGRADLISTIDTFFYANGSTQISKNEIEYDSNYNPVKRTSIYDKSRGLNLETRMYYPYAYNLGGAIGKLKTNKIFAVISSEQWITGDANPRIVNASITDYQELPKGYIKPINLYGLESNAPIGQSVIGVFNPNQLIRNSTYIKAQQNMAVYDTAGNVLEMKHPVTNESNVVLLDYSNQFPVATISNAALSGVAYTSFESDSKGQWTIANYVKNSTAALTGKYCYNLSSGAISKSGLTASMVYIITYWTKNSSPVTISGTVTPVKLAQQNGWNLYTQTITGVTSVTISGSGLIDELRLHPKDANMVTTTYEAFVGAISICDANNTVMYNEYDDLNRLIIVRDKDRYIAKKNEFSNRIPITLNPNWQLNGEISCFMPLNGQYNNSQTDMNIYSLSFNSKSSVYGGSGNSACSPSSCPDPITQKVINFTCETGAKVYTSTVYKKICDPTCAFKWECTYHYWWSDGSISGNYIEYSTSACSIEP